MFGTSFYVKIFTCKIDPSRNLKVAFLWIPCSLRLGSFYKIEFCENENIFKLSKILQKFFFGIYHYKKMKTQRLLYLKHLIEHKNQVKMHRKLK